MRRFAIALPVLALAGTAAAADFEGRAEYRVTGPKGQQGTAEALVGPAGARFHFELTSPEMTQAGMPGMKATTLIKADDRSHLYIISDEAHAYKVVDTDPRAHDSGWKVTKLGPSSVAGYPCQRVRVGASEDARPAELCVSTTLGRVPFWATSGQGDEGVPAALAKAGLDGIPIRWAPDAGEGDRGLVLELVKATRESLPSSAFEVPAGYTKRGSSGPSLASPDSRARLEDALKKITPDQRKRLEQLLRGKGSGN